LSITGSFMFFPRFFSRLSALFALPLAFQFVLVGVCESAQTPEWGGGRGEGPAVFGEIPVGPEGERATAPTAARNPKSKSRKVDIETPTLELKPSDGAPSRVSRVVIDSGVVSEAGTEPLAPPASEVRVRSPVPSPPSGIRGAPIAPPTPVADDDTVRVDLLLPMSGPNAKLGEAMLNAAQLALFDFADNNFELALHDTAGDPFFATEAAQKAVSEDASLIIGPLLGRSVRAIRSIVRSKGVPMIAFSSDGAVAGNGIYTMGFLPEAEVERVTDYAIDRGLRRFAVMAPDSDYGRAVVEAFAVSLEIAGGELIRTLYYDPFADDYATVVRDIADYDFRHRALLDKRMELRAREDGLAKEILRKLKNLQTIGDLPYDALLVADGGERLANIAALLPFYDVDPAKVRMLGTGQWDVPGLGAEPALLGGWYAAPDPAARAEFERQYSEAYGVKPPRLATLAYDAAALAAVLARSDGGPDFSTAAITRPAGFVGSDGIFRFLSHGVAQRGLAVLSVGRRNPRVLSKAPKTFGVNRIFGKKLLNQKVRN